MQNYKPNQYLEKKFSVNLDTDLGCDLDKYNNELVIIGPLITIYLAIDQTSYEGKRIYSLKQPSRNQSKSRYVIDYYQTIEEAFTEFLYRLKISLLQELENPEAA